MALKDLDTAARLRDIVREIARQEIESQRPKVAYARSVGYAVDTFELIVQYPNGAVARIPCPSFQPDISIPLGTLTGLWEEWTGPWEKEVWVRILGDSGDRYVDAQINSFPEVTYASQIAPNPASGFRLDTLLYAGPPDGWFPSAAGFWHSTVASNPTIGNGNDYSTMTKHGNMVFLHLEIEFGSTSTRGGNGAWSWDLPVDAAANCMFTGSAQILHSGVQHFTNLRASIDNRTANGTPQTLIIRQDQTQVGANFPIVFATAIPSGSRFVADIAYTPANIPVS